MMAIEKSSTSSCRATTLKDCNMEEASQEQPIHSGHFMITNVHAPSQDDDEYDDDSEDVKPELQETGFDFNSANKTISNFYPFGQNATLSIDDSLTKLFDCMSLAYSGKLTSPKWKAFRGLHLTMKDKVRLNNIIWREWCMQYRYGKKPTVCQFASPLSDDIHTKPEAIVLEGKYWKRRLDTVTKEYKSWRKFSKSHLAKKFSSDMIATNAELLAKVMEVTTIPSNQQMSATDLLLNSSTTDFMDLDFNSDTLFNTLNQPFAFPNPKEFYGMSTADLMQPGLVPLQPNLDDLMDYDSIQDIVTTRSQGNSVMYFTGNQSMDTSTNTSNSTVLQFMDTRQSELQSPGIELQPQSPVNKTLGDLLSGRPQSPGNKTLGDLLSGLLGSITTSSFSDINSVESQLISRLQQQQQQPGNGTQQQNRTNNSFFLPQNNEESSMNSMPTVTHSPSEPVIKVSSLEEALLGKNPILTNQTAKSTKTQGSKIPARSKSVPQVSQKSSQKKEGNFVKPVKPATRPKQRKIAPNPTPSPNNTYLAQLLTTGTYPGAIINVKKETGGVAAPSLVTIQGQQPTTSPMVVTSIPVPYNKLTDILLQTQNSTVEVPKDTVINFVSNPVTLSSNTTVTVPQITTVPTLTSTKPAVPVLSPTPTDSLASRRSSYPPTSPSTILSNPTSPSDNVSVTSPSGNQSGDSESEFRGGEHRRLNHTSAEQKRRCNIKSGFDLLHTLIPSLSQNPNAKVSKAAMLQKTAEYCKKLKAERKQMQNEAEILKQEIESLNVQISQCQAQLPATGVPVTRQRADQMKEMFQEYVKNRTLANWKFWIFSTIIQGLFDTYNNMVSTASIDELCRTTLAWLDQHCSLVVLRPAVLNALRQLSTTTSILSDPSRMPEHATEAVLKTDKSTGS